MQSYLVVEDDPRCTMRGSRKACSLVKRGIVSQALADRILTSTFVPPTPDADPNFGAADDSAVMDTEGTPRAALTEPAMHKTGVICNCSIVSTRQRGILERFIAMHRISLGKQPASSKLDPAFCMYPQQGLHTSASIEPEALVYN